MIELSCWYWVQHSQVDWAQGSHSQVSIQLPDLEDMPVVNDRIKLLVQGS